MRREFGVVQSPPNRPGRERATNTAYRTASSRGQRPPWTLLPALAFVCGRPSVAPHSPPAPEIDACDRAAVGGEL